MSRVEVTAAAMAAGGDALAREESGRVVFVEGALPGERVVVELTSQRKDFARGHVVEVLEASPDRVAPPCAALAAGCGGCQWQHVDLAAQGALKRSIALDALRRIAKMEDPPLAEEVRRPASWQRTSVRAGVVDGRAGFHRRHGTEVVAAEDCLTAHPRLAELLAVGRFDGADEVLLRVSVATGERLAVARPSADDVVLPDDVRVVGDAESAWLTEEVAGRHWRVSAASFFQPSPDAAALIVDAVREAVGDRADGATVLDAYAGVGLLGGSLAPGRLIAVESSPAAADDARANLADLDAEVVEGEVAVSVGAVEADLVVADPARPGLGPSASAALAGIGAPRLVLVSCDPASAARDAALLRSLGYGLVAAQVLDLFPHTFHLELVATFDRR